MEFDGKVFVPHPSGRLLTPYTLDMEREFQQVRSELARRYGVANELNRVTVSTEHDWIGIAASGHTYHELREALALLGLPDDDSLRAVGVRLFHLLLPVPVDEQQVRDGDCLHPAERAWVGVARSAQLEQFGIGRGSSPRRPGTAASTTTRHAPQAFRQSARR